MGFAALETMEYAFVALLNSQGNLFSSTMYFLYQVFYHPAGYASWTGLIYSILGARTPKIGKIQFNSQILKAFITTVLLHTLWDTLQSFRGATFIGFINLELLSFLAVLVSLALLIWQLNQVS